MEVPAQKTVGGKKLTLNGSGVRSVTFAMIPIKAYVAAFYAPRPLSTEAEAAASPGPLEFDFTFLRAVGQADVTKAWNAQFGESVSAPYPGLKRDQAAFVQMFGPLENRGVETVVIAGDQTKVYDAGEFKGAIQGRDFQKAFLSLWFGSSPVSPELKRALLGK